MPAPALAMATSLISVPKIWIGLCIRALSKNSTKPIASEYTSSPVEQPGTQMRTGASADLCLKILEKLSF